MRHLLDIVDLTTEEIDELIALATDVGQNKEKYSKVCNGKILATLFFEPSTRTRMSFESAMLELGGDVIVCSDINSSSISKGESIRDTIRVVGNYADIIAMRHPYEGTAYVGASVSPRPIINAGDGGHCHPTQTLADLLTIHNEIGRLDNLTIGVCGDLKYGRTVHSLINAMIRYKGVKFVFISPKELALPKYVKQTLEQIDADYQEVDDLEKALPLLDVLYMTRVQRERFDDQAEYERVKDCYVLTVDKLSLAKDSMRILHPLPRVNEISQYVDADSRAAYFRQTYNGKLMRKALIIKLLSSLSEENNKEIATVLGEKCTNKKCISHIERELPHKYVKISQDKYKCLYCETIQKINLEK